LTGVFVDSNVLIDVLGQDPTWERWSADALRRASDEAPLVINPIVYGEISLGYRSIEALNAALDVHQLRHEAIPWAAAFLAGRAYRAYRERGGTRSSLLPDFYIGAHAAVAGYRLLTRDPARYRTSFPLLEVIAPR
jgi:predicted nucleic acid-binding protein